MSVPIAIDIEIDATSVDISPQAPAVDITPDSDGAAVILVVTPGSPGVPGASGGSMTYVQSSPAATWTVPNTLGRYPSGITVTVGGEIVEADINPGLDQIVITFASAQTGRVDIT